MKVRKTVCPEHAKPKARWNIYVFVTEDEIMRCSVRRDGLPRPWKQTAKMVNNLVSKKVDTLNKQMKKLEQ